MSLRARTSGTAGSNAAVYWTNERPGARRTWKKFVSTCTRSPLVPASNCRHALVDRQVKLNNSNNNKTCHLNRTTSIIEPNKPMPKISIELLAVKSENDDLDAVDMTSGGSGELDRGKQTSAKYQLMGR